MGQLQQRPLLLQLLLLLLDVGHLLHVQLLLPCRARRRCRSRGPGALGFYVVGSP